MPCCSANRCRSGNLLGIDVLVAVRIPSTLLKPAALLLLGASAVLSCSVANALTFDWATTGTNNNGSGTFDITDESVTDGGIYTITAITGNYNGAGITILPTNSFWGNDNLFQYDELGTWKLNINGISFVDTSNIQYNLFCRICDTTNYSQADESNVGPITSATATASASAAPAPLPILGLPAVLFYSRKIKKRIKGSRELSSSSLV